MRSKTFMATLTVNILEISHVTFWDLTLLQVVLCSSTYICVCVCVSHSVVSDSLWPHGLQPTRLLCPWNSQGKNPGVDCQYVCMYMYICMYMCIYIWFLKAFYWNIIALQCCVVSALQHSQSTVCVYALPPPPPYHSSRSSQSTSQNWAPFVKHTFLKWPFSFKQY